jgi:hypothetical protein
MVLQMNSNNIVLDPLVVKDRVVNADDLETRLETLALEIERLERAAIFEIALRLAVARDIFRYQRDEGGFQGWVERRLGYCRSKAYDLLNVAKLMKVCNASDTFGTLPVSAVYRLAAPATPESAREDILERLKSGERLSRAAVDEIITSAKQPADAIIQRDWRSAREYVEPAPTVETDDDLADEKHGQDGAVNALKKKAVGEPESEPPIDLVAIWATFSKEQKRAVLDCEGRAGLAAIMSPALLADLSDHVIGLAIATASTSTNLAIGLTKLLRLALSTTSDNEAVNALIATRQKLSNNGRSSHDVAVALVTAKKGKKHKA